MVEVNLKRTFSSGEWKKRVTIKDNVIIVEKVGIWPMCALLNIKLQQKRTKWKREKLYKLLTSCIQPTSPFSGLTQFTHLNTPKIVLIQRLSNRLTSGHLTMIFSHLTPE